MGELPCRPFLCAANCAKSHGRIDLVFGQSVPWTTPVPTVTPLACAHAVCLECVAARPDLLTRCAQCGFSAAKRPSPSIAHSTRKTQRTTAQQQVGWVPGTADQQGEEEVAGVHPKIDIDEIACQVCGSGDDEAMMVLCDDCPRGYHTYCLSPPLQQIPSGDWFCLRCSQQREENKKRAMDRAAEYWSNKRGAASSAAHEPAPTGTAHKIGMHTVEGSCSGSDSPSSPPRALRSPAQPSPGTIDGLRSGFVEYCRQMQPSVERADPHLSRSAVLGKLASGWRALSDANKQKYATLAANVKRQQRLSAVAAEVNGAMAGRSAIAGAASPAASYGADAAPTARSHGPVVPLFVRATRQVMEGSEYWMALAPTGEGRLEVEWRIPDAATCVIVALGWAQGRPAYVERTDSSSVLQREGVVHFTEAHIARFAGHGSLKSNRAGASKAEDQEGGVSPTPKSARPLVMRLWRDSTFGEHVATTEPFVLRYVNGSSGAVAIDKPTDADWVGDGS